MRKGVDCVERVGSKSRKVGLEVKSQTPACCVHLAAEVTTIRLFTTVASDVVVVVARGGKALSAHVTGVRFLTLGRRDVNKSKRKTKEKDLRTSMQKKKRFQEKDKKNLGKGNTHQYANVCGTSGRRWS